MSALSIRIPGLGPWELATFPPNYIKESVEFDKTVLLVDEDTGIYSFTDNV